MALTSLVLLTCISSKADVNIELSRDALYNMFDIFIHCQDHKPSDILCIDVSTLKYPFMDKIAHYINQCANSCTIYPYTTKDFLKGYFEFMLSPHFNTSHCDDFEQPFAADGSYYINVFFSEQVSPIALFKFQIDGISFTSQTLLTPFFTGITNFPSPFPGLLDIDEATYVWSFEIFAGVIVKAFYHESELLGDFYYDLLAEKEITSDEYNLSLCNDWRSAYFISYL